VQRRQAQLATELDTRRVSDAEVSSPAGPFGEVRADRSPPARPGGVPGHDRRVTVQRRFAARGGRKPTCMTRSRPLLALLLAVTLLSAMAAPASAATEEEQREAVRARQAQLAAKLKTEKATEAQLLSATRVLNEKVAAQSRLTAAAQQAADAAEAEYNEANTRLVQTKAHLDKTMQLVVDHAVDEYISPRSTTLEIGGDTTDLAANARREALLNSVNASTADVLDELNAAREDFDIQTKAAKALRDKAMERKAQTESALSALKADQAANARLLAAVAARRRDVQRESAAQAAADSRLTAIINSRSSSVGGDSGARSSGCIFPARGTVTSEYGTRWGRLHAGMDIANSIGTPIWASKAGTVIFAGQQSGYGNVVIIDHGGGFTTLYAHMSRIGTSQGARVGQGQTIGAMGNSGRSTGPHVHFETRYGGSPRNPRSCLS
jgi:murein DD-endopeptidase MepM/ murein hydrolase activator NlpD